MSLPPPEKLKEFLTFAQELAILGGRHTLKYFRTTLKVEQKKDDSPVTIADRETEQLLRREIKTRYPAHGILGEEFGEENPGAPWRWILDPIDGTTPFIRGVPLYSVLIALEFEGDARLGVIHNPPLDETVAAADGLGCTFNGKPCRVSETPSLAASYINCTDWSSMMRHHPLATPKLLIGARAANTWADAYGYLMVATGRMDAMMDPVMSVWDSAAMKPIIQEAGGRFTDLAGVASIYNGSALATNGKVHDEILEILKEGIQNPESRIQNNA